MFLGGNRYTGGANFWGRKNVSQGGGKQFLIKTSPNSSCHFTNLSDFFSASKRGFVGFVLLAGLGGTAVFFSDFKQLLGGRDLPPRNEPKLGGNVRGKGGEKRLFVLLFFRKFYEAPKANFFLPRPPISLFSFPGRGSLPRGKRAISLYSLFNFFTFWGKVAFKSGGGKTKKTWWGPPPLSWVFFL